MWGAERACKNYMVRGGTERVEFRDRDTLKRGGWRQQISSGASEQGLTGAGRAREEEVVMAGNSDREGAFCEVLPLNVVQKRPVDSCLCIFYNNMRAYGWRLGRFQPFKVESEIKQGIDASELDTRDELSLRKVRAREDNFGETGFLGGLDDVNNATDGLGVATEGEFSDDKAMFAVLLKKLAREDQNVEGNGQIEVRAILGELGGSKVNGDLLAREGQSGVKNG